MEMLIGSDVKLSDGSTGKVIMLTGDPLRPLIETDGTYLDMSKVSGLTIDRIL